MPSVNVNYFQSNQNVTTPSGNMVPSFTNKLNTIISNLQYQLNQIEAVFTELASTNGTITSLQESLAQFVDDIKNFQTDITYLSNYTSYTTGVSITCDILQTITLSGFTQHFFDGTSKTYSGTTWDLQSADTQYFIWMDSSSGTFHHSTDINDMIQTGTKVPLGQITTPKIAATSGTTGSSVAYLGQTFM